MRLELFDGGGQLDSCSKIGGLDIFFLKKRGQTPPLFVLFSSFSRNNDNHSTKFDYGKSVDGVLGIRTQDRTMVGADDSTEHKRPLDIFC